MKVRGLRRKARGGSSRGEDRGWMAGGRYVSVPHMRRRLGGWGRLGTEETIVRRGGRRRGGAAAGVTRGSTSGGGVRKARDSTRDAGVQKVWEQSSSGSREEPWEPLDNVSLIAFKCYRAPWAVRNISKYNMEAENVRESTLISC